MAKKLPSQEGKSRWVDKRFSVTKRGGTELDAMVEFLGEERDSQRALGWLDKDKEKEPQRRATLQPSKESAGSADDEGTGPETAAVTVVRGRWLELM